MPISNKFHFEQFSPGFVIVYTNYCVDSFEHLHLGKGPFTHRPRFFWGRDICELFGETIRNMFRCVCYFVIECDGYVMCGWRCSIGSKNVCVVPVVPVSV